MFAVDKWWKRRMYLHTEEPTHFLLCVRDTFSIQPSGMRDAVSPSPGGEGGGGGGTILSQRAT